jgi:hypothetical protein
MTTAMRAERMGLSTVLRLGLLGLGACAKSPAAAHPEWVSAHEKMEAEHQPLPSRHTSEVDNHQKPIEQHGQLESTH